MEVKYYGMAGLWRPPRPSVAAAFSPISLQLECLTPTPGILRGGGPCWPPPLLRPRLLAWMQWSRATTSDAPGFCGWGSGPGSSGEVGHSCIDVQKVVYLNQSNICVSRYRLWSPVSSDGPQRASLWECARGNRLYLGPVCLLSLSVPNPPTLAFLPVRLVSWCKLVSEWEQLVVTRCDPIPSAFRHKHLKHFSCTVSPPCMQLKELNWTHLHGPSTE